jgi:hypothetical protein
MQIMGRLVWLPHFFISWGNILRNRTINSHFLLLRSNPRPDPDKKQEQNLMRMERRLHERKTVAIDALLEAGSGPHESLISDLSLGGCYVESLSGFSPGEPVAFDLTDTSLGSVGFTGEVAYVREGCGFGLRFTNIGPDQLEFLQTAIPQQ